jgi:hypothetical protein
MSFPSPTVFGKILTLAGMAGVLAACNSGGSTSPAPITPQTNLYGIAQTVTWSAVPPALPAVFSFDISFVDPTAHQYYVADRTTNGVTVIDTQTMKYVLTAGQGLFKGFQPAGPGGPATNAGPNGIVPIGGGIVFAGDGDGTLKVVNINTGALLQTQTPVNPYAGPNLGPGICGTANPTGVPSGPTGATNQRVDEMAYDPTDGVVLAINDAACPPFGTFFSTTAPYAPIGTGIAFATATGGAEQPSWDATQGLFIQALPSTVANPNGEVDLIGPTSHAVVKRIPITSNCQPAGTALGPNETLFLGCSSPGEILTINAATGAVLNTISGLGGCDEVWYNPTANRFYAACSSNTLAGAVTPELVVADGSGNLITNIVTSTGAHSVAVDPTNDHIYLPTQKFGVQIYSH